MSNKLQKGTLSNFSISEIKEMLKKHKQAEGSKVVSGNKEIFRNSIMETINERQENMENDSKLYKISGKIFGKNTNEKLWGTNKLKREDSEKVISKSNSEASKDFHLIDNSTENLNNSISYNDHKVIKDTIQNSSNDENYNIDDENLELDEDCINVIESYYDNFLNLREFVHEDFLKKIYLYLGTAENIKEFFNLLKEKLFSELEKIYSNNINLDVTYKDNYNTRDLIINFFYNFNDRIYNYNLFEKEFSEVNKVEYLMGNGYNYDKILSIKNKFIKSDSFEKNKDFYNKVPDGLDLENLEKLFTLLNGKDNSTQIYIIENLQKLTGIDLQKLKNDKEYSITINKIIKISENLEDIENFLDKDNFENIQFFLVNLENFFINDKDLNSNILKNISSFNNKYELEESLKFYKTSYSNIFLYSNFSTIFRKNRENREFFLENLDYYNIDEENINEDVLNKVETFRNIEELKVNLELFRDAYRNIFIKKFEGEEFDHFKEKVKNLREEEFNLRNDLNDLLSKYGKL